MLASLEHQRARIRGKYWEPLLKTADPLPPLPLVHRTASLDLFRSGIIATRPSPAAAAAALGADAHAYFFVGVGAYPKGQYAILCRSGSNAGTYTPFDTGAVALGFAVPKWTHGTTAPYSPAAFIEQHVGPEADLDEFVSFYVKTHFESAPRYLRADQDASPDRDPYHGLTGGDRRSWTVEVQRTSGVDLGGVEVMLVIAESTADRDELLDELPPGAPLRSRIVALPTSGYGATFTERIATYVIRMNWGPRGADANV
ncbi:MAG: hypothetical protein IV100_08415 [Myxococcales bacterium]|nr:hypothetical protein [Myxococcales bacterium]